MASKQRYSKLILPVSGSVTKRNSFAGFTILADYNVGDQRILVLERPESSPKPRAASTTTTRKPRATSSAGQPPVSPAPQPPAESRAVAFPPLEAQRG